MTATHLHAAARMPFHTDLRAVFAALGGRQRELRWLVTDVEVGGGLDGMAPDVAEALLAGGPLWMGGDALTALADAHPVQWIWGVLSGFPPGALPEGEMPDPAPWADGNDAVWRADAEPQHPRATVEIVCWDSSATLLLSRDDDLTRRFRAYFPEARAAEDTGSRER